MNRETTSFETPIGKHKVTIKTFLNGRERRALTNVYLSGELEMNTDGQTIKGVKAELIDKAQNLAWETVIVSINESTENIVETILDMHSDDYEFVIKQVNAITTSKEFEQKKTI